MRVTEALSTDPAGWVCVPLMFLIGESAKSSFDVLAAARIVECSTQRVRDEGAATPTADTLVELRDEVVLKTYVQSHGHTLTH